MLKSDFITIKIRRTTYKRWKVWLAEQIGQEKKIVNMQDFIENLKPERDEK